MKGKSQSSGNIHTYLSKASTQEHSFTVLK